MPEVIPNDVRKSLLNILILKKKLDPSTSIDLNNLEKPLRKKETRTMH
jgi:hypothetical protein